jgi:hypothetical protein
VDTMLFLESIVHSNNYTRRKVLYTRRA